MADTFTANYNLTKPEPGASRDSWGAKINAALDKIDAQMKANADLAAAALPKAGGTVTGAFTANGAASFGSTVSVAGTLSTGGVVNAPGVTVRPAGWGGLTLVSGGGSAYTGYVDFLKGDGTRAGYVGFAPTAGGAIELNAGAGFFYNFVGANPTVGGAGIWHANNFNPATKATLGAGSNVTFGDVRAQRADNTGVVYLGNGDRYVHWNGSQYVMPGGELILNGTQVARNATQPRFTGVFLGTGLGYVYSDPNAHNVVFRAGDGTAGAPYTYAAVSPTEKLLRTYEGAGIYSDGNLRAAGDVIVGEGKASSTIQMRDSDEGTRSVHNNSSTIGFLNNVSAWVLRTFDDGNLWTPMFGYLSEKFGSKAERINPTVGHTVRIEGNGGVGGANTWPSVSLWYGGIQHWQMSARNDGYFVIRNGDDGDVRFSLGTNGSLWLKQIGDLNTRIEDRAYAWAADRASYRVAKTGDSMSGDLTISKGYPSVSLLWGGVREYRLQTREDGHFHVFDITAGASAFRVAADGSLWCRQLGDLNTRIEDRANAYASGRVAKGGDTMTGDLHINKAWPTLNLTWGGVRSVGWQVRDDAQTYLWDHTAGTWNMRVDTGGSIVARGSLYAGNGSANMATNGDIWGAAWGNRWLTSAMGDITNNANGRVAKTGDGMSGNLVIGKEHPELQLVWGGVFRWGMIVRNNAELQFRNADNDSVALAIRPSGSLWSQQMGDIAEHIRNVVNNKSIRLAYAGDLDNNWNINTSYAEPYQGGVLTSRYTTSNQFIVDSWKGGRWRYLQMSDAWGNWYTCGYV